MNAPGTNAPLTALEKENNVILSYFKQLMVNGANGPNGRCAA